MKFHRKNETEIFFSLQKKKTHKIGEVGRIEIEKTNRQWNGTRQEQKRNEEEAFNVGAGSAHTGKIRWTVNEEKTMPNEFS